VILSPRFLLFALILLSLGSGSAFGEWKNFEPDRSFDWKTKEKLKEKIHRERFILAIVSKQNRKVSESSLNRLRLLGAGLVNAPHHFTLENIQRFDELSQASGILKEARYDKEKSEWRLSLEALKYKAKIRVAVKESKDPNRSLFRFRVMDGTLEGLEGVLELLPFESQKTEIALTAYFDYGTFPLPDVFTKLGMEFVLQKIAERMRSTVEQKYRRMRTKAAG